MTSEDKVIYKLKNPRLIENVDMFSMYVANVRREDHPDYVDAYIEEAYWKNGDPLSEDDLDWLNEHSEIVHQAIFNQEF